MSRTRRRFTAEQKAQIVRRHLAGKEPVSKLSEEFGLQPSQIHTWVNQVLAQADKAFDRWVSRNVLPHRQAGYAIVTVSLKPTGIAPGDATDHQMEVVADLADAQSQPASWASE